MLIWRVSCGKTSVFVEAPNKYDAKAKGVIRIREKDKMWHTRGRVTVKSVSDTVLVAISMKS